MEIGSAHSSGLQGFKQASNQITQDSANIARQTLAEEAQPATQAVAPDVEQQPAPKSLESSVVSLTSALYSAQANVRSIETADQVLGSAIDIRV